MRTRVAIVDDDDIQRRGMAEYLADRPEIEVVGMLDHTEAMDWDAEWDRVDVVLVDVADPSRADDQFPGVHVADRIRRRRSSEETTVIVVTGHFFDDAVRRRMREAGADYFSTGRTSTARRACTGRCSTGRTWAGASPATTTRRRWSGSAWVRRPASTTPSGSPRSAGRHPPPPTGRGPGTATGGRSTRWPGSSR